MYKHVLCGQEQPRSFTMYASDISPKMTLNKRPEISPLQHYPSIAVNHSYSIILLLLAGVLFGLCMWVY